MGNWLAAFVLACLPLVGSAAIPETPQPEKPQPGARLSLAFSAPLASGQLELRPYPSMREKGYYFLLGEETKPALVLPLKEASREPTFELPFGFWLLSYRQDGERRLELPLAPFKADRDAGRMAPSSGTFDLQIVDEEGLPIAGALVALQTFAFPEDSWKVPFSRRESNAKGFVKLPRAAQFSLWVRAPGFATLAATFSHEDPPTRLVLPRQAWQKLQVRDLYRRALAEALVSSPLGVPIGFTNAEGELDGPFAERGEVLVVNARNQLFRERIFTSFSGKLRAQVGKHEPVRGEVLDRSTGAALPGAWVWLEYRKEFWTRADRYGQFEIDDTFRAPSDLRADAPHYSLGFSPADRQHKTTIKLLPADRVLVGQVHDLAGEPIVGAEVRVHSEYRKAKWSAVTDEEGSYRLGGLPAERLLAEAQKAPYFPLEKTFDSTFPLVRLDFELELGGKVLGRVLSDRGVPLSRVSILLDDDVLGDSGDPRPIGFTGDDGNFVVGPLQAGSYLLVFEKEAFGRLEKQITLAKGQEELDLQNLEMAEEQPWSGRVVDEGGQALPKASIFAWISGRESLEEPPLRSADAISDDDGRFEVLGLRSGQLVGLEIRVEGRPPVFRRVVIDKGSEKDWVVPPGAMLAVTVRDPRREPVFFANVSFSCRGFCKTLETSRITDEEGRVRFPPLPEGEIELEVKSENFGVWRRKIELEDGQSRHIVVLLGEDGSALEGRIFAADGKPAAGYRVSIEIPTQQFATTRADAEGFYRLEGLPEGTLSFAVSPYGSAIPVYQQKVELRLPQHQLDVVLPHKTLRALGVLVLDQEQRPLAGVDVAIALQGAEGGGPGSSAASGQRTDQDGVVIFRQLPAGEYFVGAAAPDATWKGTGKTIKLDRPSSELVLVLEKVP